MNDQPNQNQDQLWLMLGEIRGDLKYLVNERRQHVARLEAVEMDTAAKHAETDARVTRLEHFRTKIGVLATSLGIAVPTIMTVIAHKLGLLN